MYDEEFAILDLPTITSDTRYEHTGQHAVIVGWGRGRTTTLSVRMWKEDGSYAQPHRPVSRDLSVAMAGASTLCLRWANRWLVQGARERAFEPAAPLRPRTQDGDGRGGQLHVRRAWATTTTPLFIVTGAVEFVAHSFDDRVRKRWNKYALELYVSQMARRSTVHVLVSVPRYIKMSKYILDRYSKKPTKKSPRPRT